MEVDLEDKCHLGWLGWLGWLGLAKSGPTIHHPREKMTPGHCAVKWPGKSPHGRGALRGTLERGTPAHLRRPADATEGAAGSSALEKRRQRRRAAGQSRRCAAICTGYRVI